MSHIREFLGESRWQSIHGIYYFSPIDLSRLMELHYYAADNGMYLAFKSDGILLMSRMRKYMFAHTNEVSVPVLGVRARQYVFVHANEEPPSLIESFVALARGSRVSPNIRGHARFLHEILEQHVRAPVYRLVSKASLAEIRDDVSEWISWARLPCDINRLIAEYLFLEDDFFEWLLRIMKRRAAELLQNLNTQISSE